MLQGRPHDHTSKEGNPDLLLMVIGSPQGVTLQLTQYRRLHQQTMGTEDEHRAIPERIGRFQRISREEHIPEDSSQ